jgi:hypothetical protein
VTIYWVLFAFAAVMALAYPIGADRAHASALQRVAYGAFALLYVLVAALRYETGGDWSSYEEMYEDILPETLGFALTRTDPLFGLLNWVSAQFGGGVYLVNLVASAILVAGVVQVAKRLREPWLAILITVPYLLIVVGMGYVRQAMAIGLLLMAITNLDRGRPLRSIANLIVAAGSHASAALAFPLFGYAMSARRRLLAVLLTTLGAVAFVFVIAPLIATLEAGYIEAEYDSEGAAVRLLMSLLPSLLLLARLRAFETGFRVRSIWVGMAIANLLAMAALIASPSSTAVDRIGLYFAPIQLVVFGEMRDLTGTSDKLVPLLRIACIALAAAVQIVWLGFATHSSYWVPYQSVLQFW